jgi:hypothetical protein
MIGKKEWKENPQRAMPANLLPMAFRSTLTMISQAN